MERQVTYMGGNPITLIGPVLKPGDKAPDFTAYDHDLSPVGLKEYSGKVKLISVVPSLDTGVCDAQTRRFNQEAASLGDGVVVLTLSMDLPFAQARWCGAAGIDKVITLSDYRDASFGKAYGVLIKELRLLNRAIFIIDKGGIVRYVEVVEENHNHPNYEDAIEAVSKIVSTA